MVYFIPKSLRAEGLRIENVGMFIGHLVYFTVIWYIFHYLVNFVVIAFIFPQEKSGIPSPRIHPKGNEDPNILLLCGLTFRIIHYVSYFYGQ
jgi:hypothetical protein